MRPVYSLFPFARAWREAVKKLLRRLLGAMVAALLLLSIAVPPAGAQDAKPYVLGLPSATAVALVVLWWGWRRARKARRRALEEFQRNH